MITYASSWAVLGALKSKLLNKEVISSLEKTKDFNQALRILTPYLEYIPSSPSPKNIEHSLNIKYIKSIVKILRFLREDFYIILLLFIKEFDLFTFKVISKSIFYKKEIDRSLLYLDLPFLFFSSKMIDSISTLPDLIQICTKDKLLRKIYLQAFEELNKDKNFFRFSSYLDREYLRLINNNLIYLDNETKRILKYYIEINILIWIIRLKFIHKEKYPYFYIIEDKSFSYYQILRKILESKSVKEALSFLEEELLRKYKKTQTLQEDNFSQILKDNLYHFCVSKKKPVFYSPLPYICFFLNQKILLQKTFYLINSIYYD